MLKISVYELIFFLIHFNRVLTCKHIGNKTTFYDTRCSEYGDTLGCNAGGQGKNCRYCGFERFPECPTPATVSIFNETHLGSSLNHHSVPYTTSIPFIQRSPLYGVNYSPFRNSTVCTSITESMIDADMQIIYNVADAIKLYSMECNLVAKIVQKARDRGIRLILGLRLTSDESHYRSDRQALDRLLLERSDLNHVIAVSVGQDSMTKHRISETMVIEKLRDIRNLLHSYGYNQIPVTTCDTFEKYNSFRIVEAVDIILPNFRIYSSEISAELSPSSIFDMMKRLKSWSAAYLKEFIVGETGWPTGGDLAASPQSSWSYLKRFRCQAISAGLKYFYFEAFDANWKLLGPNHVDSHYGLATFDRHLKTGFFDALRC